jgi:hypothetical protein
MDRVAQRAQVGCTHRAEGCLPPTKCPDASPRVIAARGPAPGATAGGRGDAATATAGAATGQDVHPAAGLAVDAPEDVAEVALVVEVVVQHADDTPADGGGRRGGPGLEDPDGGPRAARPRLPAAAAGSETVARKRRAARGTAPRRCPAGHARCPAGHPVAE